MIIEDADACLRDMDKLIDDNERLRKGIEFVMLILSTNTDVDGNSMKESDAYEELQKLINRRAL